MALMKRCGDCNRKMVRRVFNFDGTRLQRPILECRNPRCKSNKPKPKKITPKVTGLDASVVASADAHIEAERDKAMSLKMEKDESEKQENHNNNVS